MIVNCPRCGKPAENTNNPFRPFCSQSCKMIDLGNWISGSYRISRDDAVDDDSEATIPQKDSGNE